MSIHGPSRSLVMIYDMKNFRLGHLTRNNFKAMKAFFTYMQEGMTTEIGDIHIFNTFPSFNLIMKLISPFLKAETAKKVNKNMLIDIHGLKYYLNVNNQQFWSQS